jgi:hypothetical protein
MRTIAVSDDAVPAEVQVRREPGAPHRDQRARPAQTDPVGHRDDGIGSVGAHYPARAFVDIVDVVTAADRGGPGARALDIIQREVKLTPGPAVPDADSLQHRC